MQGWWGHLANQITQGLCIRVACAGVAHAGLHAEVAHAGVVCKGCVHRGCVCRVVGTLSQSDYTRVVRKGGRDTQPRVARAGVTHTGVVRKGCRM